MSSRGTDVRDGPAATLPPPSIGSAARGQQRSRALPDTGSEKNVDAGGLSPNTWERLERLSSAWEQAKRGLASQELAAPEQGPGVVLNPTRRSRTPLTPEEVEAIRTARSDGQSATAVAKRFEVHRGTVWAKTR